jgi:hypothetical protein
MPYVPTFRQPDFLCKFTASNLDQRVHLTLTVATVDISLWSTVEVGVSVVAANIATLRPLIHHLTEGGRSWSSRVNKRQGHPVVELQEIHIVESKVDSKDGPYHNRLVTGRGNVEHEAESTRSLTRSTRQQ